MRPFPLTTLTGGINRLQVKGNASASNLYDLLNAYITNEGTVTPREGTNRSATLDSNSVGLMYFDGVPNIFAGTFTTSTATVPSGYNLNVLLNPVNASATPTKIWFAKPFMGFPFVTAQFSDGSVYDYWLQNNGSWTSATVYTSASIVTPDTPNGFAYQGVRDFPTNPLWTADTIITSGSYVEPNEATGYAYKAIAVAGTSPHTGSTEPVWPTVSGGQIQEFGDFDTSSSDAGTTQGTPSITTQANLLSSQITDRYGDSSTIAGSGTPATANFVISTASTKVTTWKAGTLYAPGAVVVPTNTQGAFTNAIPNGDFENGNDGNWDFVSSATNWAFSNTGEYQGNWCLEFPSGSTQAGGDFAIMNTFSAVTSGQSVTATAYADPNNAGANLDIWIQLNWYNASETLLSSTVSAFAQGGGYRQIAVTGTAPPGATLVKLAIGAGSGTNSRNTGFIDLCSWSLATPALISNFLYEAVQSVPASSGTSQPVWPTVAGNTVTDGGVTWEAIGTSIITWEAVPLMLSGNTQPTWPTINSGTVLDVSSFTDANGAITSATSFTWQLTSRVITDVNDPQTIPTVLGASHVFKGNKDIVSYSAAVNPTDWTSTNNAGYLPSGLNNYGDNPVAMLALYRSNLMIFNSGGYQMWQIDPDPANMAILDAQPVGSTWPRAAQSVANDLLFLTEVGVRNLSTIGATANMAIGDTGQPVDPIVKALLNSTPVPGDPFYPDVGVLLPLSPSTGVTDLGPDSVTVTTVGTVTIITGSPPPFQGGSANFNQARTNTLDYLSVGLIPGGNLDLSTGSFTIEGWIFVNPGSTGTESVIGTMPAFQISISANAVLSTASYLIGNFFGDSAQTDTGLLLTAEWNAFAFVYTNGVGGQWYINGIASSTNHTVHQFVMTDTLWTFGSNFAAEPFSGNLADLRITKDVARYSSNYNPLVTNPMTGSGSPFTTQPTAYDPLSLYYPGRGQYWLIFGPQALVLTINGMGKKTWSRYVFPQSITDWSLSNGNLYLRTSGNLVWVFTDQAIGYDDGTAITTAASPVAFNGVIQWPYVNAGTLGINKMMIGVDIVGTGSCSIQIGYNQSDPSSFSDAVTFSTSTSVTAPYFVSVDDTVPEEPLPIPINAPSYSVILSFAGSTTTANAWTWEAANLYLADMTGGGATG